MVYCCRVVMVYVLGCVLFESMLLSLLVLLVFCSAPREVFGLQAREREAHDVLLRGKQGDPKEGGSSIGRREGSNM